MAKIDYRELLIKYLRHVEEEEGCTFTGLSLDRSPKFTDAERAELRDLEKAAPQTLGDMEDKSYG